jgi:hypothetical protein
MSEGQCWAAHLGGCGGPITVEHLVSKSLLGEKPWFRVGHGESHSGESAEFHLGQMKANILCKAHNEELGRTADWEANRLLAALRAFHHPTVLRGSHIHRKPIRRELSGVNYARWLCKTHCNIMIAHGKQPDPTYVCYSFLHPLPSPVHFYFPAAVGETRHFADARYAAVSWRQWLDDGRPTLDLFSITFGGFETVVSTIPLRAMGRSLLDRLRRMVVPTPLGPFHIDFDWDGEPRAQSANCDSVDK